MGTCGIVDWDDDTAILPASPINNFADLELFQSFNLIASLKIIVGRRVCHFPKLRLSTQNVMSGRHFPGDELHIVGEFLSIIDCAVNLNIVDLNFEELAY
jgi:hypothetical protein